MISFFINRHKHAAQPDRNGKGGLCPLYPRAQSVGNVHYLLRCLSIQNELNQSYESDLDMT